MKDLLKIYLKDKEYFIEIVKHNINPYFNIYLANDFVLILTIPFLSVFCENVLYFLMCEDEKAIGIAKLEQDNDSVEIVSLYILEEYRNNGFGKQVLAHINSLWKTKDIRLWVLKDNLKARNFYEKSGFVNTGLVRTIWRGNTYEQLQYEYPHGKI